MALPSSLINRIQNSAQRVPGIDLLRGLCILAVVVHHINLRVRLDRTYLGAMMGSAVNRFLFWSGYNGVIVFFVISGFLITTWSMRRWGHLGQISCRQFYLMRFARIVPCLLGLLAILAVLDRLGVPRFVIDTHRSSLPRALLAALTFHINWLESRVGYLPASWDVLWSLSIEEVFYIFFPILCTFLRKQWLIVAFLCCFLVIGPWARVHTQNQYWAENGYLSCMDGIALGCLAAIAAAGLHLSKRASLWLATTGALFCVFINFFRATAFRTGLYKAGLDITVLELGTALLLIALQVRFDRQLQQTASTPRVAPGNKFRSWVRLLLAPAAGLRWFGRNSYEIYLTHMFVIWPMFFLFERYGKPVNAAPALFLVTSAFTGLVGWIAASLYSEPLNRWLRQRLTPRKMAAVTS